MTEFEKIKAKNLEEFAEWFDEHCSHDGGPVIKWWSETYCKNCKPEIGRIEGYHKDMEFAWCELHGKCRFFPDMEKTPDTLVMTKMWLKSEFDDLK